MPRASMASVYGRVMSSPKFTNRRNRMAMWRGCIGTRASAVGLTLRHLPAVLLVSQPGDEGANGVRQRRFDGSRRRFERPSVRIRLGNRESNDRRLRAIGVAMRGERDVAGLQRALVRHHLRAERRVDEALDLRNAAIAGGELKHAATALPDLLADLPIRPDVGSPKTVDRLLRIADDEQLARDGRGRLPVRHVRIIGRQ